MSKNMFVVVKNLLFKSMLSICDYRKIDVVFWCRFIVGKGKGYVNMIFWVQLVEI